MGIKELILEKDVDGIYISDLYNLRYLSGFSGTTGSAFIMADKKYFFTDFRYKEQAVKETKDKGFEVVITDRNSLEFITDFIIKKDNIVIAVLDAKYKHYNKIGKYADIDKSVSRDDLYQMATYLYHYGNKNENIVGLFISPIEQSEENIKILNNSPNHQIGVVNLNIAQFNSENCVFSLEKVKEAEKVFIKKIKRILNETI